MIDIIAFIVVIGVMLIPAFAAHEGGHVLVATLMGFSVTRVTLSRTHYRCPEDAHLRNALVGLGGPAANLVLMGALHPYTGDPFILSLALANFATAAGTLLPLHPRCDGWQVLIHLKNWKDTP